MKRMARMGTKKSHSWWWDSHISPKNSKWLADNLEEMDRCVKEMLKLIEEDGDSFSKKAEMYYQKRPELIAHVEDFYRMYRGLAERYDHVTGELRKNIPSVLQSSGSGSGSDFGSEPPSPSLPSPELTPECKPPRPRPGPRAAGFDFFLGSGGSSDRSRRGSDGSSSSESDSDSDDSKDLNCDDISSALHQRIVDLENELRDAKEKLHEQEVKGSNGQCERPANGDHVDCDLRISAMERELKAADQKLQVAETEISSLKQKFAEKNASLGTVHVEPSLEKEQVPELGDHVDCDLRISALEKELKVANEKLQVAAAEILNLKEKLAEKNAAMEIGDVEPNLEKKQVSELEKLIVVLEAEVSRYKREVEDLNGAMVVAKQQKLQVAEIEISSLKQKFAEKNASLGTVHVGPSLEKEQVPELEDHVDCDSSISALEKELKVANEKLQVAAAEILNLKEKLAEKNAAIEIGDVEPNLEKKQVPELEKLIVVLEAEVSHYKREVEDLNGAMVVAKQQFEVDLSHRDNAIEECKAELASLSKTYLQDKSRLGSDVANLEGSIEELKSEIKIISQEKSLLEAKVVEQEHMLQELKTSAVSSLERFSQEKCTLEAQVSGLLQSHTSLEAKLTSLKGEIKQLEDEKMVLHIESGKQIEELNKNLDVLKLKVDTLMSEKEALGAKVSTLITDVECRDDRISQMNEHLHQLHLEHMKLITEIEAARRTGTELRSRVKELEEEVDMQRAAILDGAEGKREAIRQLCFSLEHYRNGYHRLRQVLLHGHKRPAMIVT